MALKKRPVKKPPFPTDATWTDVERIIQHLYRYEKDDRYDATPVHNAKSVVMHKGTVTDCPPNSPGVVARAKIGERKLHIGSVIWLTEGVVQ